MAYAPRRRRPLRTLLIIAVVAVLPCCGGVAAVVTWALTGNRIDTFGKVDFSNALSIPPLAQSTVDEQGRRVFTLTAQEGVHDFGSGRKSPAWGFNGTYLGPTLRATAGEKVAVNVKNTFGQTTTVHWHGIICLPSWTAARTSRLPRARPGHRTG
jgi:FtsP/CotA-like multicopper oxidase with cupredoxin domain